MRNGAFLLVGVAFVACGARSTLVSGEAATFSPAAGGAGGSSTSTSTSSSTSGTGGAPSMCWGLVPDGPPIGTVPDLAHHQRRPALTSTHAGEAVAVFALEPVESPIDGPVPIGDAAPLPWDAWPADLGPAFVGASGGGDELVAGASIGTGVALLHNPMITAPYGQVYLSSPVPPGVPNPVLGKAITDINMPTAPAFLTAGKNRWLAGTVYESPSQRQLELHVVDPGPEVFRTFMVSGCATGPVVASGVAVPGGFLAALSSSRDLHGCLDDGPLGPARRLQVARWSSSAPDDLPGGVEVVGVDDFRQVELAPRAGGAWLAWQETGASAELPPPIMALALGTEGQSVGAPVKVSPDGATSGPFAVATLGDALAVAWVADAGPSGFVVQIVEPGGALGATASVPPGPDGVERERIALLASPQQDQLLLAWSTAPGGGVPARFQVTRLSCVVPD